MPHFYSDVSCIKCKGGKNPLWHARKPGYPDLIGAGNTAENAINDLRREIQNRAKRIRSGLTVPNS